MAFYNENGSYAYDPCDPDYNGCPCLFHFKPDEFKCPPEFWSNDTVFLQKLQKLVHSLMIDEWTVIITRPDGSTYKALAGKSKWRSPDFRSLSDFRMYISLRLDYSLDADAEAAGLFTERDIFNYYYEKKKG